MSFFSKYSKITSEIFDKEARDKIVKIIDVTGIGQSAVFLIRGKANILFEAGMAFSQNEMMEKLKKELQGEKVDAVLLSHSHYDHVAGLPLLKREWPDMKVYASKRAKEILVRPSALATIRELSEEAALAAGREVPPYRDEELQVDIGLEDGDEIQVGGYTVKVLETIGHTKCSLSYIVDDRLMLCSETVGVMNRKKEYMPSFLVDYYMAEKSIERSRKIPVKEIILNHYGLVVPEDRPYIWDILDDKLKKSKAIIIQVMKGYDTEEERLKVLEEIFHAKVDKKEQPDEAFYINASSMMRTLFRQFPDEFLEK